MSTQADLFGACVQGIVYVMRSDEMSFLFLEGNFQTGDLNNWGLFD